MHVIIKFIYVCNAIISYHLIIYFIVYNIYSMNVKSYVTYVIRCCIPYMHIHVYKLNV